jgi:hypothetical protein
VAIGKEIDSTLLREPDLIVFAVGNGVCASTCALFTTIMHELHSTVIAVFGGPPTRDMEYKGEVDSSEPIHLLCFSHTLTMNRNGGQSSSGMGRFRHGNQDRRLEACECPSPMV